MTSQSAGAQWLRNPNSSFARPRHQLPSQQTPRSVPSQTIIDVVGGSLLESTSEPACKRQRLDDQRHAGGPNICGDGSERSRRNSAAGNAEEYTTADDLVEETAAQTSGSTSEHDQAESHTRKHATFPVRPGRNAHWHQVSAEASGKIGARETVQIRPYVAEPPSSAPRYQEDGPADFFPWTGNHPEDVLNKLATEQGYFDKLPGSQTESGTARPSIWSSLKHKSGLQILSSLFVSALDQRQTHGTITANSTFKPPPRVTLTDTKREAWLRDLSNSSIPLRRLSRTIPHGIRGKMLLDHCLAKQIPISRAIWLAKCVGANEIRAFKRKGASGAFAIGGETKWIKDWTTNVEQFVEMIIAQCGTPEWRSRVKYGLRLATQFFSEHLLDQEHYLDWLVASLHASDIDNIPIWLLIIQIHWKEIVEHRQPGRRLAEALLEQLYRVNQQSDEETFASVKQQLVKLLKSVVISAPACLLLPRCWIKYETTLQDCSQKTDDVPASCLRRIARRNARLTKTTEEQSWRPTPTPRRTLISLLDSTTEWTRIARLTDGCLTGTDDGSSLVITCLEWASSSYRHGHAKVYIAARILRRWSKQGVELEKPILDFLAASPDMAGLQKGSTYKLLAELIRSKHFLAGKYLQWLMARGTLARYGTPNRDGPCDVRLLFELPLHGLPTHVLNLRNILLSSVGASVAAENNTITLVRFWISGRVPGVFPAPDASATQDTVSWEPAQLSQTVKSDIGRWIRQSIASYCRVYGANRPSQTEDNTKPDISTNARPSNKITMEQYHQLRLILEEIEDFAILADVLKIVSNSTDDLVLTSITDTINNHFDTLAAVGAVDDLFQILWQQYQDIHNRKRVERCFVESLTDLGARLPKAEQEFRSLRKDLLLYEQTLSAVACSPISDHMAEALESAESTFADEIDQLLASGTSMDKQVLSQVFQTIIKRLEFSWHGPIQPSINFAKLLVRLRSFGAKTFDLLVADWLGDMLSSTSRPSLSAVLPPLICSKSITLDLVLSRAVAVLQDTGHPCKYVQVALDVLDLLTLPDSEYPPPISYRQYRFGIQQQRVIQASPSSVICLIRAVIDACVREGVLCTKAQDLITSFRIRTLMQVLSMQHTEFLPEISGAFDRGLAVDQIQIAIDSMIYPADSQPSSTLEFRHQISRILDVVSDFNLPLCQLRLRTAFSSAVRRSNNAANTLMTAFLQAARSLGDACMLCWPMLVSGLAADQALRVRAEAESELISDVYKETDRDITHRKRLMDSLASVIEATAFTVTDGVTSSVVAQVADKLAALPALPQLLTDQPNAEGLPATTSGRLLEHIYISLDVLLRLLLIHQPTLQHPKFPQSILARLLTSLSMLLINPAVSSHPILPSYIFDTLAILTDLQTEETRSRCIRTLRDQQRTKDPRLLFLFGYTESIENEWLQLVPNPNSTASDARATGPAIAGSATPATQAFPLRRWEMMQDATPLITENDTSLSLTLFGARKAVL